MSTANNKRQRSEIDERKDIKVDQIQDQLYHKNIIIITDKDLENYIQDMNDSSLNDYCFIFPDNRKIWFSKLILSKKSQKYKYYFETNKQANEEFISNNSISQSYKIIQIALLMLFDEDLNTNCDLSIIFELHKIGHAWMAPIIINKTEEYMIDNPNITSLAYVNTCYPIDNILYNKIKAKFIVDGCFDKKDLQFITANNYSSNVLEDLYGNINLVHKTKRCELVKQYKSLQKIIQQSVLTSEKNVINALGIAINNLYPKTDS